MSQLIAIRNHQDEKVGEINFDTDPIHLNARHTALRASNGTACP
jgi:hypothetical protein